MTEPKVLPDLDMSPGPDRNSNAYWRVDRAFTRDYAMQMLSRNALESLAAAIVDWAVPDDTKGRINFTAVRVNLPKFLATTPFAVFGEPMLKRTTDLVLRAWWSTSYDEQVRPS